MSKILQYSLSKRERQIMEVIYRKKNASVKQVLEAIPDPPSYSAVRAMLNILKEKGLLRHRKVGRKYIYLPVIPHKRAVFSAVKQLLNTYFNNSLEEAVTALIEADRKNLTEEDFARLSLLIEKSKQEGLK